MGPCEAFYASAWQHPVLLWLAALAAAVYVARRSGLRPSLRVYTLALVVLSLADAWLTSSHVYGIGALTGEAARLVPLFFVLAGDFRFLLLVEAGTAERGIDVDGRSLAVALVLTGIVPILSQAIVSFLPDAGTRVLFLVYEIAFFVLTLVLLQTRPALRAGSWLRPVAGFVLLYYGLWATADLWILITGADAGFALRVVPNLLYYGGLIAMIARVGATGRAGH